MCMYGYEDMNMHTEDVDAHVYVYMNRETRDACALLQARQQQVAMTAVHF